MAAWICDDDPSGIAQQHDLGKIVTTIESDSGCGFGRRYDFQFPSEGYMCVPSAAENLPDGWLITGENKTTPTSLQVTGDRICEGAIDWAYIQEARPSGSNEACSTSPIPNGYVVSQYPLSSTGECRISRMEIRKPAASASISVKCVLPTHSVPEGYVIRDVKKDSRCKFNNSTGNREGISLPSASGETKVCDGTIVPGGFAYSSLLSSSTCDTRQGFTIGPVSGSRSAICARSNSDIPAGYVVTGINAASAPCGGLYSSVEVQSPSTSGNTAACQLSLGVFLVPDGFVVTEVTSGSGCAGRDGYVVTAPSSSNQLICAGSPVPEGWAVTSETTHPDCAITGSGDALVIDQLDTGGSGFVICPDAALPAGFIRHRKVSARSCSSDYGWEIIRPDEAPGVLTTMCGLLFSDIPEGFVVSERDLFTNCSYPSGATEGFRITRPSPTGLTLSCNATTFGDDAIVPAGYVAVEKDTYSDCGVGTSVFPGARIRLPDDTSPTTVCNTSEVPTNYLIIDESQGGCNILIALPNSSGDTFACRSSDIPSGYVITRSVNSDACTLNQAMTVALPNINGPTLVCAGSPVPTGFITATYGNRDYDQCNGSGFIVIPEGADSGGVVPTPFINTEQDITARPADPTERCDTTGIDGGLLGTASRNPVGCN